MRLSLPQPYEDLGHIADVGVAVEGRSEEEALARLVLAYAALLTGGEALAPAREEIVAASVEGRAGVAVALLRELLYRFRRVTPSGSAAFLLVFARRLNGAGRASANHPDPPEMRDDLPARCQLVSGLGRRVGPSW